MEQVQCGHQYRIEQVRTNNDAAFQCIFFCNIFFSIFFSFYGCYLFQLNCTTRFQLILLDFPIDFAIDFAIFAMWLQMADPILLSSKDISFLNWKTAEQTLHNFKCFLLQHNPQKWLKTRLWVLHSQVRWHTSLVYFRNIEFMLILQYLDFRKVPSVNI